MSLKSLKNKQNKLNDIKNSNKKRFTCTIFLIIFLFSTLTITVKADDSSTRSIVGDWFNKVFSVELTNGDVLLETDESKNNRKELNDSIYNDSVNGSYSLYDRFGGQIQFIPYFGETKISTGLADRFYTKYVENDGEFSLTLDDIKKFFESPAISNNVIYENRANILSQEEIDGGNVDPRVSAYSAVSMTGGDASLGNLSLTIANAFVQVVAWLSSGGLFKTINDIWTKFCDAGFADFLQSIVLYFLPLCVAVFVFLMVKRAFKSIKGHYSFRKLMSDIIGSLISLGLVFSLMINPTAFSSIFESITTIIDNTLDSALQIDADEVIKSDKTENVRAATLWKNAVFEPWCKGMFDGYRYEELYTQFDENNKHVKMPQSNDDVQTTDTFNDGGKKYNSVNMTGDVQIKIGDSNKDIVRNWGALAWSCQSNYHIDSVENQDTEDNANAIQNSDDKEWPKALTTPMNDKIYIDNFRWLDAKLNISPEYISTEETNANYSNSRSYKQNFIACGAESLWMALLLIPIGILSIRKLKCSLVLVASAVKLCYYSMANLVIPEKYDVLGNLKRTFRPLYDFFWWSMIIFVSIVLYSKFTGHGFMVDIVWIVLSIYLNKFKPIRTPNQLRNAINNVKSSAKRTFNSVSERINKKSKK